MALIKIYNDLLMAMDDRKVSVVCFLDVMAALNTIAATVTLFSFSRAAVYRRLLLTLLSENDVDV